MSVVAIPFTQQTTRHSAPKLGGWLGRYRLERQLGAGGMGVVYAAFDPSLERRVAIKVLRAGSVDAPRLLREARAMARLDHPNVVTVHEVANADGRDYIAMEMIDGESLADWLHGARRPRRDVLAAMIAAGRGLAAAHAAGLVHRDFKPHNVLRGRTGRIAVTDFGLARGLAMTAVADPLAVTSPLGDATPAASDAITATGLVMGTPAYMAPEQWAGEDTGPATDQFAFCVATWEALTGARPFRGTTADEVRTAVQRGPTGLDGSRLPRRLAKLLRRGLDPDPARRWPSLDALLSAIERVERRPRIVALAVAATALVGLGALAFAHAGVSDPCAGVTDPSAPPASGLPDDARRVFADTQIHWDAARDHVCHADAPARERALPCLAGVRARLDAVAAAAAASSQPIASDLGSLVIDPAVCTNATPPRLATSYSPAAIAALAVELRVEPAGDAAVAPLPADADPCTRAIVQLVAARPAGTSAARDAADDAARAADQCGDDRMRFDALYFRARYANTSIIPDPKLPELIDELRGLRERLAQPDVDALVTELEAERAGSLQHWDLALADVDRAIAALGAWQPRLQVHTAVAEMAMLLYSHDHARLRALAAKWRPIAKTLGSRDDARMIELVDTYARWFAGDVAAAHARLAELRDDLQRQLGKPEGRTLSGVVVDGDGRPVAGATVAYGPVVMGDSAGIALSMVGGLATRLTTTDAGGHYVIDGAPLLGAVIAQLGDRRSLPGPLDAERLVLAPTSTIRGHADTGGDPHLIAVMVQSLDAGASGYYAAVAPIRKDGTYELAGAPRGRVNIGLLVSPLPQQGHAVLREMMVTSPTMDGVDVALDAGRVVRVIVRSASSEPLAAAHVLVLRGHVEPRGVAELMASREQVSAGYAHVPTNDDEATGLHAGDLVASVTGLPAGEATVCVVGLSGDQNDTAWRARYSAHLDRLDAHCAPLPAGAATVTLEATPIRRID